MVAPIFKDTALQARFQKQGFVVVDFLDAGDLDTLNLYFDQLHPDMPVSGGFVSGSYSNDLAYKKKASDLIVSVFSRHYERLFINYQPFGAAFLYKLPSQESELGVHQDWTIVDEEKYVALNCWVPLTDINESNGALHVLPGSQYSAYPTLRAPTIPFFFTGSEREVIEATIPQYVRAGQAVILNESVIHYSPPNRSDKIRKAITAGVKTLSAPMIFHYREGEGKIERFEMREDFLLSFTDFATSIFQRPDSGRLIASFDFKDPVLEKKKVGERIKNLKAAAGFPSPDGSIFTRLKSKIMSL
jgi:hypothetical protein